jgi:hypothetical protein
MLPYSVEIKTGHKAMTDAPTPPPKCPFCTASRLFHYSHIPGSNNIYDQFACGTKIWRLDASLTERTVTCCLAEITALKTLAGEMAGAIDALIKYLWSECRAEFDEDSGATVSAIEIISKAQAALAKYRALKTP